MGNTIGPKDSPAIHSTPTPASSESGESSSSNATSGAKLDQAAPANQELINKGTQQQAKEAAHWQGFTGDLLNRDLQSTLESNKASSAKKMDVEQPKSQELKKAKDSLGKMDKEIEAQTNVVKSLTDKSKKSSGAEKKETNQTIDIETKKLERMITKREQMFQTLSKIVKKFDESSEAIINKMRG